MSEKTLDQREFIKWAFKNNKARWILFMIGFSVIWFSWPTTLGGAGAALWNAVFLVAAFLFFAHLTVQLFIDDLSIQPQIPIIFATKRDHKIDITVAMFIIAFIALLINGANFIFTHFIEHAGP
jgi:divalent metal cation (Fe/Co/Zn/Cd) transporter